AGHRVKPPQTMAPGAAEGALAEWGARQQRLEHPRLARLHTVANAGGDTWLLFEYVAGFPLSSYAEDKTWVGGEWVTLWLAQLLEIIAWLHEQSQCVGSLTPGDLVVADDGLHLVDPGYI